MQVSQGGRGEHGGEGVHQGSGQDRVDYIRPLTRDWTCTGGGTRKTKIRFLLKDLSTTTRKQLVISKEASHSELNQLLVGKIMEDIRGNLTNEEKDVLVDEVDSIEASEVIKVVDPNNNED